MDDIQKVLEKIDSFKNDMVNLQKEIIPLEAISPVNGGSGELKKARFLEPILKEVFDEIKWYNAPHKEAPEGIRPNIVCILRGKDTSKTLWFMAHMDVVPPGEKSLWQTDPWQATIKDGKIYGRGTEDNHQGLVSSFFAIKAIKDSGVKPACNLALLLVSDEEMGSGFGMKYLLAEHPEIFGKDDMFIVPDAGSKDGSMIEVAEKGIMRIKVTVMGKQAHAAHPHTGINASRVMAHFTVMLDELKEKYNKENKLFKYPISTFEPTRRFANEVSFNTVPEKEVQFFDMRIIPDYNFDGVFVDVENIAKELEKKFNAKIEIEKTVYDKPAPISSIDSSMFSAFKDAVKLQYGVEAKPFGEGGGTVARFLRYRGCNVYLWSRLDETMHIPNEYCWIDNLVGDSKVFARVALTI